MKLRALLSARPGFLIAAGLTAGFTIGLALPAHAQSSPYFGTYKIVASTCLENGVETGAAKAAVRFEFKNSPVGRVFQEIDNADGVKGSATYYFDGGRSPFGAGEYTLEETATHFMAFAHRRIDGKTWIEKTESFEITPVRNNAYLIKITRAQISNYASNNSVVCTFATKLN